MGIQNKCSCESRVVLHKGHRSRFKSTDSPTSHCLNLFCVLSLRAIIKEEITKLSNNKKTLGPRLGHLLHYFLILVIPNYLTTRLHPFSDTCPWLVLFFKHFWPTIGGVEQLSMTRVIKMSWVKQLSSWAWLKWENGTKRDQVLDQGCFFGLVW